MAKHESNDSENKMPKDVRHSDGDAPFEAVADWTCFRLPHQSFHTTRLQVSIAKPSKPIDLPLPLKQCLVPASDARLTCDAIGLQELQTIAIMELLLLTRCSTKRLCRYWPQHSMSIVKSTPSPTYHSQLSRRNSLVLSLTSSCWHV